VAQKPVVQVPVDMVWHWQDDAACRESDVSTFFHPSNARGRERTTRERAAKSICLSCVVRTECADYAIRSREPYGVWGGLTEGEREAMIARGLGTRFDRAVSA
jgi:WhiB family redox-sensing transcriptional regulator